MDAKLNEVARLFNVEVNYDFLADNVELSLIITPIVSLIYFCITFRVEVNAYLKEKKSFKDFIGNAITSIFMFFLMSTVVWLYVLPVIAIGDWLYESEYEINRKWFSAIYPLATWCATHTHDVDMQACMVDRQLRREILLSSKIINDEINEINIKNKKKYDVKKALYSDNQIEKIVSSSNLIHENELNMKMGYRSYGFPKNKKGFASYYLKSKSKDPESFQSITKIYNVTNREEKFPRFSHKESYDISSLSVDEIYLINMLCQSGCTMNISYEEDYGIDFIRGFKIYPPVAESILSLSYEVFDNNDSEYSGNLWNSEVNSELSINELEVDYVTPTFILKVQESL